ncbi:MAG: hypothetical protein IJY84_05710 [Clostridia bacterium]|nr:hypothetical protein [Clostridia bacterium]
MQKISYMDNDCLLLLDYLKEKCQKEYCLLQVDEVLTALKEQLFLGVENPEQQLFSMLNGLSDEYFIDLKYADGEVFLVKPLAKSFNLSKPPKKQETPPPQIVEFDKKQVLILLLLIYSLALLGGFLGGILGGLLC